MTEPNSFIKYYQFLKNYKFQHETLVFSKKFDIDVESYNLAIDYCVQQMLRNIDDTQYLHIYFVYDSSVVMRNIYFTKQHDIYDKYQMISYDMFLNNYQLLKLHDNKDKVLIIFIKPDINTSGMDKSFKNVLTTLKSHFTEEDSVKIIYAYQNFNECSKSLRTRLKENMIVHQGVKENEIYDDVNRHAFKLFTNQRFDDKTWIIRTNEERYEIPTYIQFTDVDNTHGFYRLSKIDIFNPPKYIAKYFATLDKRYYRIAKECFNKEGREHFLVERDEVYNTYFSNSDKCIQNEKCDELINLFIQNYCVQHATKSIDFLFYTEKYRPLDNLNERGIILIANVLYQMLKDEEVCNDERIPMILSIFAQLNRLYLHSNSKYEALFNHYNVSNILKYVKENYFNGNGVINIPKILLSHSMLNEEICTMYLKCIDNSHVHIDEIMTSHLPQTLKYFEDSCIKNHLSYENYVDNYIKILLLSGHTNKEVIDGCYKCYLPQTQCVETTMKYIKKYLDKYNIVDVTSEHTDEISQQIDKIENEHKIIKRYEDYEEDVNQNLELVDECQLYVQTKLMRQLITDKNVDVIKFKAITGIGYDGNDVDVSSHFVYRIGVYYGRHNMYFYNKSIPTFLFNHIEDMVIGYQYRHPVLCNNLKDVLTEVTRYKITDLKLKDKLTHNKLSYSGLIFKNQLFVDVDSFNDVNTEALIQHLKMKKLNYTQVISPIENTNICKEVEVSGGTTFAQSFELNATKTCKTIRKLIFNIAIINKTGMLPNDIVDVLFNYTSIAISETQNYKKDPTTRYYTLQQLDIQKKLDDMCDRSNVFYYRNQMCDLIRYGDKKYHVVIPFIYANDTLLLNDTVKKNLMSDMCYIHVVFNCNNKDINENILCAYGFENVQLLMSFEELSEDDINEHILDKNDVLSLNITANYNKIDITSHISKLYQKNENTFIRGLKLNGYNMYKDLKYFILYHNGLCIMSNDDLTCDRQINYLSDDGLYIPFDVCDTYVHDLKNKTITTKTPNGVNLKDCKVEIEFFSKYMSTSDIDIEFITC